MYRLQALQKDLQLIEHTAEQPFYQMSYYCVVENAVTEKVYIIETDYNTKLVETMLLASEILRRGLLWKRRLTHLQQKELSKQ